MRSYGAAMEVTLGLPVVMQRQRIHLQHQEDFLKEDLSMVSWKGQAELSSMSRTVGEERHVRLFELLQCLETILLLIMDPSGESNVDPLPPSFIIYCCIQSKQFSSFHILITQLPHKDFFLKVYFVSSLLSLIFFFFFFFPSEGAEKLLCVGSMFFEVKALLETLS